MTRIAAVLAAALCVGCAATMTQPTGSGTVKITALGSHDGEFCILDRALVLEDPDGTRILYDAGFTVRGAEDGLVVYLSGDPGSRQNRSLSCGATTTRISRSSTSATCSRPAPAEAAHVINEMVKPAEVILSHANEVATKGGKVIPGTRTDMFLKAVKVPSHVPLSGKTMVFDGGGTCVSGC